MTPPSPGPLKVISPGEVRGNLFDPVDQGAKVDAERIINDIKAERESALLHHAVRLGDIAKNSPYLLYPDDFKAAFDRLTLEQQGILERTAERIRRFAQAQRSSITAVEIDILGGKAGQDVAAMEVAGCYAPGGRYPLPSSVLMTAITARVAGVKTVIVASPRPVDITLGAAHVAGADYLLAVGGAQAVGALAYGVKGVPQCDIIVGPGNKWVTAAKSLVAGKCAIDMLAGPSECLVIADESIDPSIVAADLLAQAEHDVLARPILVTTSASVIDQVNSEITKQLETLGTASVARVACTQGFAVLCPDLATAVEVSDKIAPEHLEIMTQNSIEDAKKVKHFGGLFIGKYAAEVLGDYGAGPNHVLPTGATARYTGGLSVHTFLRIRTWMRIDEPQAAQELVQDAEALALLEGLEGHAKSVAKRRV